MFENSTVTEQARSDDLRLIYNSAPESSANNTAIVAGRCTTTHAACRRQPHGQCTNEDGRSVVAILVVIVGLLMAVTIPVAHAANSAKAPVDRDSNTYGNTYGEWSARWWQWALSIPADTNPVLLDDTSRSGAHCGEGQSGPVWFLASSFFGGTFTRTCTVPSGKALFFPIVQAVFGAGVFDCFPTTAQVPCNLATLRKAAADSMDPVTLTASIDGKPLRDLSDQRVQSPVLTLTYPNNNVVGVESGTYEPNVSDGYWVMFAPLSAGTHTIRFKAVITGGVFAGTTTTVTYKVKYQR